MIVFVKAKGRESVLQWTPAGETRRNGVSTGGKIFCRSITELKLTRSEANSTFTVFHDV